jgi:hypothetical protein
MIVRPRTRRSRRPIVLGAIVVVVLAMWAIMRRPAARQQLEAASRAVSERLATWRAVDLRPHAAQGESRPIDADTTADVEGFANATDDAGSPTEGVNAPEASARTGDEDGIPAFEESQATS